MGHIAHWCTGAGDVCLVFSVKSHACGHVGPPCNPFKTTHSLHDAILVQQKFKKQTKGPMHACPCMGHIAHWCTGAGDLCLVFSVKSHACGHVGPLCGPLGETHPLHGAILAPKWSQLAKTKKTLARPCIAHPHVCVGWPPGACMWCKIWGGHVPMRGGRLQK